MDQAIAETLELLRLRAELLAILRGPDADRQLQRWLLLRRSRIDPKSSSSPAISQSDSSLNGSDSLEQ